MAEAREGEIVPAGLSEAGEILREGGALIRLENQTQMQVAVQRPRKEALILKSALEGLTIYPELAEKAIYKKPVGKDETGKMKFATGLSVRAAEDLANRWDNSSYGAEIIGDDGKVVSGVAVFVDYERNLRRAFPFRVSRAYKDRNGNMRTHPEDRFNDVVVKANLSKALRECLLRSLPAGLKVEYERKAREINAKAASGDRGQAVIAKTIRAFKVLGVSQEEMEKVIGKALPQWDGDDIETLVGIYNAIEDNDTTIGQAFGREQPGPAETEAERKARAVAAVNELKGMAPAPESAKPAPVPPPRATQREIERPAPEPPPEREPGDEPPEPSETHEPAGVHPIQPPSHKALADELYLVCKSYAGEAFAMQEMESCLTCPVDDADVGMLTVAVARAREKLKIEAAKAKRKR